MSTESDRLRERADRLRRAMNAAGFDDHDLSVAAELPKRAINLALLSRVDLSDQQTKRVAAVLCVSPSWLASGEPSPVAARVIDELRAVAERGGRLDETEVERLVRLVEPLPSADQITSGGRRA